MDDFVKRLLALAAWSEEVRVPIDSVDILELMIESRVISVEDALAAFKKARDQVADFEVSIALARSSQDLSMPKANDNAAVVVLQEDEIR